MAHPSFSKSAGNSGSLGRLLLNRRNMMKGLLKKICEITKIFRKCKTEWGVVGYESDQVRVRDVGVRGHGKRAEPIVTSDNCSCSRPRSNVK